MMMTFPRFAAFVLAFALLGLGAARPAAAEAVKFYIMVDVPDPTQLLALDRWYLRYHGPEMHRAMKAWQRSYVSYRSVAVPAEAERYGAIWRGRLTEIQYDRLEDFYEGRRNNPYLDLLTPPPGGWRKTFFRTETATLPINPPENYLAPEPSSGVDRGWVDRPPATPPKDTPYLRWVLFLRPPAGVDAEAAERWFREVHVREVARLPGLRRYVGYRSVGRESRYSRVVELWFDDYAAWRQAFIEAAPTFTAPPWGGTFPFMDSVSTFIGENPDVDFINDRRVIP